MKQNSKIKFWKKNKIQKAKQELINKILNNKLLSICFLIILLHQIFLLKPAPHESLYNLGMLFQAIILSYIAAVIFQYVYEEKPHQKNKKKMDPVITHEINNLWEILNSFTYQISWHSKVNSPQSFPIKFDEEIPKIISKLPVIQKNNSNNNSSEIVIVIQNLEFSQWSTAIEYVNNQTEKSLIFLLGFKEYVDVDILRDLSILQKGLITFQQVAFLYEQSKKETFKHKYLERELIEIYKIINKLESYSKLHHENLSRIQKGL